jgi:hypothetical protein
MSPTEIDQRVRKAYDTGYLEGVLFSKDANAWALARARFGTSAIGVLAVVLAGILAYVTLLAHS